MLEFLSNWFYGFIMGTIVLSGFAGIVIVVGGIFMWLGAWSLLLIIPVVFGLVVAIAEL